MSGDAVQPVQDSAPWVGVLANPFSGARSNRPFVARLERALALEGLGCRVAWDADAAQALLAQTREGCCCMAAAGGDGTVARAYAQGQDLPLAIVPLGNENLLAKDWGFGLDVERTARAIARGATRQVDLATWRPIVKGDAAGDDAAAEAHRFALMVSAGIDAEVVHRLACWRSSGTGLKRVTRRSYVPRALSTAWTYPYPRVVLEAEGRQYEGVHIMVFNVGRYCLDLRFCPESRDDDGLLDYVVFRTPGRFAAAAYLLDVLMGRHVRRADVVCGQASSLRILSEEHAPLQCDGDMAGHAPVEVQSLPGALRVVDMSDL